MNLNSLGWKMHDHLKRYRPKMFKALKDEGGLSEYFQNLQQRMGDQLDALEN